MKSEREFEINTLLRMCNITDDEHKKKKYLKRIEQLLNKPTCEAPKKTKNLKLSVKDIHFVEFFNEYKEALWWQSSRDNYELYVKYCNSKDIQPAKKETFVKSVHRLCPCFELKQVWMENKMTGEKTNQKVWIPRCEDLD